MVASTILLTFSIALFVALWTATPVAESLKTRLGWHESLILDQNPVKMWFGYINWCTTCAAFQLTGLTVGLTTHDPIQTFFAAGTAVFIATQFEALIWKKRSGK